MSAVKKIAIIVFVCWLSTFYCDCRPADDKKETNPIGVKDTDDEFVITKPETVDPKYTDFIDELYKHDNEKKAGKSKRDLSNISEASIHGEASKSFDLAVNDIIRDNEDEKRGRRMLIFRPLFVYKKKEIKRRPQ